MEQNEIIDGNKLIAEFTGWRFEKDDRGCINFWRNSHLIFREPESYLPEFITAGLNYHSEWDKLMPVVEKIGKIVIADVFVTVLIQTNNTCTIECEEIYYKDCAENNLIEATWLAVIDFIKYYNETIKTKP